MKCAARRTQGVTRVTSSHPESSVETWTGQTTACATSRAVLSGCPRRGPSLVPSCTPAALPPDGRSTTAAAKGTRAPCHAGSAAGFSCPTTTPRCQKGCTTCALDLPASGTANRWRLRCTRRVQRHQRHRRIPCHLRLLRTQHFRVSQPHPHRKDCRRHHTATCGGVHHTPPHRHQTPRRPHREVALRPCRVHRFRRTPATPARRPGVHRARRKHHHHHRVVSCTVTLTACVHRPCGLWGRVLQWRACRGSHRRPGLAAPPHQQTSIPPCHDAANNAHTHTTSKSVNSAV